MTESTAPQARRGEIAGWPKLVITYPTEPGRIANLLPPGLEPTGDDTVQIGIYCVPINSEPEYGVSIKVPASWQGVEGHLVPQHYLELLDFLGLRRLWFRWLRFKL